MQVSNYFDPGRFWLLMKLELFRSRKGIVMTLVIIFGLIFFMDFLLGNYIEGNKMAYSLDGTFGFTLITGGFILSSLAFGDLGSTLKKINYLMLPVSTFEKFLCMWFLTSIGWIVVYTVLFTLFSLLINSMGTVLFSHIQFIPFRPLSRLPLNVVKYYFVLQGVFLIGAVHFKGYVLPKTLFTLIIFGLVCGTIAYFFLSDVMDSETEKCISETDVLETRSTYTFWKVLVWLFWWVLAPLSWVITLLGLKEQEA